jgi:hypothetical protein
MGMITINFINENGKKCLKKKKRNQKIQNIGHVVWYPYDILTEDNGNDIQTVRKVQRLP